ncbi:hypothetical protein [Actinomadura livida]|uniref:Uncharacterized protein n=1 Tax=Actinomadura livida TaxID=79909 RepID=A0A7W7IJ02_9ACTN|nr:MULTISPECIES: hypothetical protein [Actinomadura]MBB4777880.1 hypothetical protein [Actinomadura catellatispora]GGT98037.1 hypothetical protein GCM10010208_21940 [Actinomadura livida]
MILCYASGDGLGHLTRLRAVLHTLGVDGPVTVVTASPFAGDPRVTGDWRIVRGTGVTGLAPDEVPEEVIVDAFPAGLKGELIRGDVILPGTKVTHLARLLRWDAYAPMLPADPPRFDRTFVLEPLAPAHEAYLRAVSDEIVPLALTDPPSEPVDVDGWLIVHSGPEAETLELVAYARDMASAEGVRPPMTLVSPQKPDSLAPEVAYLDAYPAWRPGPNVQRIVTAAGFNAVRQFAPWRDIHRMLPFPRSLDDQFARAARARREAGDRSRSPRRRPA